MTFLSQLNVIPVLIVRNSYRMCEKNVHPWTAIFPFHFRNRADNDNKVYKMIYILFPSCLFIVTTGWRTYSAELEITSFAATPHILEHKNWKHFWYICSSFLINVISRKALSYTILLDRLYYTSQYWRKHSFQFPLAFVIPGKNFSWKYFLREKKRLQFYFTLLAFGNYWASITHSLILHSNDAHSVIYWVTKVLYAHNGII